MSSAPGTSNSNPNFELAQAALNGNLVGALKEKAIAKAKELAIAVLMHVFTAKAGPKAPKPPWTALGEIAAASVGLRKALRVSLSPPVQH